MQVKKYMNTVFKQIKELEEFLEQLEESYKVKSKQVFYIIEDVKRELLIRKTLKLIVLA